MNQWRRALHVLETGRSEGFDMSLVCYHRVVAACSNASRWSVGLEVLKSLPLCADLLTFHAVVEAYHCTSGWRGVTEALQLAIASRLQPSYRLHMIHSDATSVAQAWQSFVAGQEGFRRLGSRLVRRKPNPPSKNFIWHEQDPDEGKPHRLSDATSRLRTLGCLPPDLECGFLQRVFQPCLVDARALLAQEGGHRPRGNMLSLAVTGLGGLEREAATLLKFNAPWAKRRY